MQISNNKVVSIHYTVKSDAGELIDTSEGNSPLDYVQGYGNIIPGLEKALEGKAVGEKLSVTISPNEGYGERNEELIQTISKEAFQGVDNLQPGMQFEVSSGQGPQIITVTKVDGNDVTIDANHPLAGITLLFDVEVASVREATTEELDAGHIHSDQCEH